MSRLDPALLQRRPSMVAIGASAGGFDALLALLEPLPTGFTLPVVALLHLPPTHESGLADVFRLRLSVPVCEARSRAPLQAGTVHFASAGYHLLVEADRTFSLSCDAPVMFSRPSIDVLFESCAESLGADAAAFLLTGANADGAQGLAAVHAAGGLTVVQDPSQAPYPTMPQAALDRMKPDAVLRLEEAGELLRHWGAPQ